MAKEKRSDDLVAVWSNTSNRHIHRDCRRDGGGLVMPPGGSAVFVISEKDFRGPPPSNVKEEIMTRAEAKKKYGKDPVHEK